LPGEEKTKEKQGGGGPRPKGYNRGPPVTIRKKRRGDWGKTLTMDKQKKKKKPEANPKTKKREMK